MPWVIAVIGIFGTFYGVYLVAYHLNHGNGLNVATLIFQILGIVSLLLTIMLVTSTYLAERKNKKRAVEEPKKTEEESESSGVVEVKKELVVISIKYLGVYIFPSVVTISPYLTCLRNTR